jgi:hypothetical protein
MPSYNLTQTYNYPTKLRLKVKFFWSDKNGVVGSKLSFKQMSVIPQTPELPGGLAPLVPCQGSALDPLGTLSGPQTPRLLTPPPNHKSWIRPWYS